MVAHYTTSTDRPFNTTQPLFVWFNIRRLDSKIPRKEVVLRQRSLNTAASRERQRRRRRCNERQATWISGRLGHRGTKDGVLTDVSRSPIAPFDELNPEYGWINLRWLHAVQWVDTWLFEGKE